MNALDQRLTATFCYKVWKNLKFIKISEQYFKIKFQSY
jgi:hypothetical protein